MAAPTVVCKSIIQLNVKIEVSSSTSFLEHTLWLEGIRGNRVEGCCPICRESFPVEVEALRENAEVRCWHCHEPTPAIDLLGEAFPGLHQEMLQPAINDMLKDLKNQFKGLLK